MTGNEHDAVLCVHEKLASGRQVVFAYAEDGSPAGCWDAATLPSGWLEDSAWHRSGVAVGSWSKAREAVGGLPALRDSYEDVLSAWLAKTYRCLSAILGPHGCTLSSSRLFLNEITDCLPHLSRDSAVLEVGGKGTVDASCCFVGCQGWAVDPTFPASNGQDISPPHTISGMVESLPFPDGTFDCVLCLFVLEHLVGPRTAIRELARVLRPGGRLVLGVPVDASPNGTPPLFHRWRFVRGAVRAVSRTMPLADLVSVEDSLFTEASLEWNPVARKCDAHLYSLERRRHE
ncbi:MAG TPA: class I SAM-dependent methyltransferase [Candidatus Paceibacterota bacterium]|nr:class I SAM-dependent methyltransferase [Verrucomicrobiota bacterium]HSA12886.1 class I SAM-dependent methyltransferase [Candidatus Paceibacterota bacterium]